MSYGLAMGIWGATVLSGYLKVITGSNTKVGLAEGIQGICQVIFAFPAGLLADRYGRDKVLKGATLFGFFGVCSILLALYSGILVHNSSLTFTLLCIGLGVWGSFVGMTSSPLEALYADSTTDENRPKMNQFKYSLVLGAASSGPLTSIVLFNFVGDRWTQNELRIVFTCGVLLLLPSLIAIFFFDDTKGLVDKAPTNEEQKDTLYAPLLSEIEEASSEKKSDEGINDKTPEALYWVPRIAVTADLMAGFASGMTIKFFPLFFKEEALMTPSQVSFLFFLNYFGMSIFCFLARKLSEKLGRPNAIMAFQIPGTMLLMAIYLMSIGYDVKIPGQVPLWRNKIFIGTIYIIRSGLMNGTFPLERSLIMEHVPSESRGYWNAFESLSQFGWSGSAVLGGYLMDQYGYGITFFITSLIQLCYTLMNCFLKIYVKK